MRTARRTTAPAKARCPASACVGSALPEDGYRELLEGSGFELEAVEHAGQEVARMTERVRTRLRGARLLGFDGLIPIEGGLPEAITLAGKARSAVAAGVLGYAVFIARLVADDSAGRPA